MNLDSCPPDRCSRRSFLALSSLLTLTSLSSLCTTSKAQYTHPFAGITRVEVFCNSAMPIGEIAAAPFPVNIYRMDAVQMILKQFNQRMPQGNEQLSYQWTVDHWAELKKAISPSVIQVGNGINRANYYHIDRLPAIVINERSVVYGVTSIATALALYQSHLQEQKMGLQPNTSP